MIKLTLVPQHGADAEPEMTIHVAGDVLTLDGTPNDLSGVPEGGVGGNAVVFKSGARLSGIIAGRDGA